MTDVKEYSTGELERLVALTEVTAKPGEFTILQGGVYRVRLRTDETSVVFSNGIIRPALGRINGQQRRVRSFTDLTELDPPVSVMQAELERRKKPVISNRTHGGRRVQHDIAGCGRVISDISVRRTVNREGCETADAVWVAFDDGDVLWANPENLELL